MFGNTGFSYNGTHSDTYNCFLGTAGNSDSNSVFAVGGIEILEESVPGLDMPYYKKKNLEPIQFKIQIFSEDEWTTAKRKQIASWLMLDTYEEFISDDDTDVVFMATSVGKPTLIKAGNIIIGVEMEFRCNAPYPFTTLTTVNQVISGGGGTVNIDTTGSNWDKPWKNFEIEFTLSGSVTDLTITNTTDDNDALTFTGLSVGETIYVDNGRRKEIISDTANNRYTASNLNWLRFLPNTTNSFNISDECSVTFRYRLPLKL